MSVSVPQAAHNPELSSTRASLRPLTSLEVMQRAKAVAASKPQTGTLKCSGQIYAAIFFDGTGNNEEADFTAVKAAHDQKHGVLKNQVQHPCCKVLQCRETIFT